MRFLEKSLSIVKNEVNHAISVVSIPYHYINKNTIFNKPLKQFSARWSNRNFPVI